VRFEYDKEVTDAAWSGLLIFGLTYCNASEDVLLMEIREKGISMGYIDKIEIDPKVCNGKPVIKGTRIPLTVILAQIAAGESWQDLVSDFPELTIDIK